MITRDLEAMLTSQTGYQAGEIDQRTRPLREHNLIPHGARGRHAPSLDPLHAALVILTMVSRRAVDAGQIAMRAMDLNVIPRSGCDLDRKTLLAPMLAAGLSTSSPFIQRVEVMCDGSIAWVTYLQDKAPLTVAFVDDRTIARQISANPKAYDALGASRCGHRFVMPAGAFNDIVAAFHQPNAER